MLMTYYLRLGNGKDWAFCADAQTRPWLETLACAMGMEAGTGPYERRIVFERIEVARGEPFLAALKRSHVGSLPTREWSIRGFQGIVLYEHAELEDIICGLYASTTVWGRINQMRCSLFPVFTGAMASGGLPIHGALIEIDGSGIILAGPSGIGKSTACRRLPHPWRVLGDDLTLLVRNGAAVFRAHPLPTWSVLGEDRTIITCQTNCPVPLSAAFFLEQAERDEAIPLKRSTSAIAYSSSALEVFRSQYPGFPQDERADVKRTFYGNSASLALSVPAYRLRVSLTGRYWEQVEQVLDGMKPGGHLRDLPCTRRLKADDPHVDNHSRPDLER
jgi:SynChlorMet cassette protein ScmC